jgi:hypothetical protein
MNGPKEPPETLSPAERRLDEHMEMLRTTAIVPPAPLVARIVHAVRWQRAIRRPLVAVGALAAAVADGVRLLFGPRTRRS